MNGRRVRGELAQPGVPLDQARTAIKNKARWLKMLRKANLLQEVAKQAAEQLRPGPVGAGPPGAAPAPVLA